MKLSILLVFALFTLCNAEKYALIFGTADHWTNYCITSEPCRMYDTLIQSGFKEENIIYMTFNSILDSELNPYPGMIFTSSAETTEGDWAKYGCFEHVDYTGFYQILREVFLGILSGDKEAVTKATGIENPKVLNAGPEDTIFSYYIDHGTIGAISVGWDYVQNYQLIEAIKQAHDKKLYGKWFWYFDACYSGTMFEDIPKDIDFYVITSADHYHEAYMNHCPPDDDTVAGKQMNTCLSALSDDSFFDFFGDHPDSTIGEMFEFVKEDVAKSSEQTVSEYGDQSIRNMRLSDFIGIPAKSTQSMKSTKSIKSTSVMYSDVPLHLAKWRAIRAEEQNKEDEMESLKKEVFKQSLLEIEGMRLGRLVLSEEEVHVAVSGKDASTTKATCIRDLSLEYAQKCKREIPLLPTTMSIIREMCNKMDGDMNINFENVCIA